MVYNENRAIYACVTWYTGRVKLSVRTHTHTHTHTYTHTHTHSNNQTNNLYRHRDEHKFHAHTSTHTHTPGIPVLYGKNTQVSRNTVSLLCGIVREAGTDGNSSIRYCNYLVLLPSAL